MANTMNGLRLVIMTIAVAIGPFIEVMDLLVANVALPHIAGSLSISTSEATYVMTSYMISNAIVLPMTGWLAAKLGYKRYFLMSVGGFTLASVALAFSQNLPMLIGFALIQGLAGGGLQPISQTLLAQNYPKEKLGIAMSIWAMTMVSAPAIGPFIGGWITDTWSWRWIFLINLPFGIICMVLAYIFVPETTAPARKSPFDYLGFLFLVASIGSLQFVLDRGEYENWFDSPLIVGLAITSAVSTACLIVWELGAKTPLLDLSVFAIRRFTLGTFALVLGYAAFFSGLVLTPMWLQNSLGFTSTLAGLALMPTGVVVVLLLLLVGRAMSHFDVRWIVFSGLMIMSMSYLFFSRVNLETDFSYIVYGRVFFGFAMVLFFAPVTTIILSGLEPDKIASGAGLSGLFRNLAASVGTTLSIAFWDRLSQQHQSDLVGHINPFSTVWADTAQTTLSLFDEISKSDAYLPAMNLAYLRLDAQAKLLSLVDIFQFASIACVIAAVISITIGPVHIRKRV